MKTKQIQLYLMALLILVAGMFVANTMAAERVTYIHFDALGSPLAGSDSDGKLVWREEYTPYGDTVDGAKTTGNIGFAGKLHDPDIGLSYFGARWYDPATGRFMGVDPADFYPENIHSFNRYTYANNNPYAYVDPDGNLPILLVAYGIYKAASIAYDAYTTYQTVSDSSTSTTEKVVAVASLAAGAVDPTGAANKVKSLAKLSKAAKSVTKSVDSVVKKGGSGGGRQKNFFNELDEAGGVPHTVFRRNSQSGRIENYQTFDRTGVAGGNKRFRGTGKSHGGVEPPLVVVPKSGHPGGRPVRARPARPDETPLGF